MRPEHLKGAKDEVKQAQSWPEVSQARSLGPTGP